MTFLTVNCEFIDDLLLCCMLPTCGQLSNFEINQQL